MNNSLKSSIASKIALGALLLTLGGCNGHIREYVDKETYPATAKENEGVRVYMPVLMKVTSRLTTYTDKDKNTSYDCTSKKDIIEIKTMADYSTPLRIYYEPGWFETTTFGVSLNADGTISAVNDAGTPPTADIGTAIPAIITAVAPLAALKGGPAKPGGAGSNDCTADPVVVKVEKCTAKGDTLCAAN